MADEDEDQQTSDDQARSEPAESDQQTSKGDVTDASAGQTSDAQGESETTTQDQSADQQTTEDQSQSDQTTDAQAAGDAGAAGTDDNCAGWFSDAESISKRAAEFFVKNELTGDRGVVEKIDVVDRDDPESYSCTVHFSDKATNIEVVVFRNEIIVREDLPSLDDRWTCWYNYNCPPPNKDLVLTKRKCNMMAPIILRLPSQ
jgi:hypothetical protein